MIKLTPNEKKLILVCKNQFKEQYPWKGSWSKTLEPLCLEFYGWDANQDNNYNDYLWGIFNKLLDTYLKIKEDGGVDNYILKNLFGVAFRKSFARSEELPIERTISELCGLIQCNLVIDNGVKRYDLD